MAQVIRTAPQQGRGLVCIQRGLLGLARRTRGRGIRVAVLSNSWGTGEYDPYQGYELEERSDAVIISDQGIMLDVEPEDALVPIRDAVRIATSTTTGYGGKDDSPWKPHITLCYSTACQPAEPVMAALGPALPAREIRIDTVSLVIQHGPERLWEWQIAGTAHVAAYMVER